MTESRGERPPSSGRTPMDVVVTAEVAGGAVTPHDMVYVVDQVNGTAAKTPVVSAAHERSSSDLTPAESASARQHLISRTARPSANPAAVKPLAMQSA